VVPVLLIFSVFCVAFFVLFVFVLCLWIFHFAFHTQFSLEFISFGDYRCLSAFLQSDSYEDTIKNAILIGGPTNTLASIAGGIAQAYFKHIPKSLIRKCLARLTPEMKDLIIKFEEQYLPQQITNADFLLNLR